MTRPTRTLAALALLAAVVGLIETPRAAAQPGRPREAAPQQPVLIPGGGTELFRALLDREGIQPVTARDLLFLNPTDDLIVVAIGHPVGGDWQRDPYRWARLAVAANGAALIASDSQLALHESDKNPGADAAVAGFNGRMVRADLADAHRNDPDCPYVVPVSPDELPDPPAKPGRVWSVFRGLTRLATNQPTYIDGWQGPRGEYQYPLARLPKSSFDAWGGRRFAAPPLFAVGGDGTPRWAGEPGYAFLAVADSSVFINQMVMEPDADNLKFALRTIEYLQGPGKHRKRCVFFENGRVVEKFDGLREAVAKPRPKIPPGAVPPIGPQIGRNQDKLVDLVDALADEWQRKDALHRMMVGEPGSERERNRFGGWVEAVAVVLAISISFFLLRRSWRARQPLDVPPPPSTGAGAASTGPPGVFDRRQKELARRNNLYEPVSRAMRAFFDSVGAPPDPGPRIPRLEISDEVRKPGSLRQAIRDMWRIAYGPPAPITAQRWFELEPYFERLKQAHADGKWRFVGDDV